MKHMNSNVDTNEIKSNTKFIDDFSKEIYEQTYSYNGETINETQYRVAENLASIEKDNKEWTKKFLYALEDFKFVPGGRITSNAGTGLKGTTYINCFVDGFTGKDQDSMEGILDTLRRQALILKSEGGYGFCADVMRPRGGYVNGIGSESPGAVKMLDMWDTQSAVITAGSGKQTTNKKGKQKIRKGAQMVTMSCSHPDIEEFITSKQTPGRLTKFNMSILVSDALMEAVAKKSPWNLEFPDYDKHMTEYENEWDGNLEKWKKSGYATVVYKTFDDANELWDLIMKSTYNRNEPGILFSDTMNKMNNLHYCEHISATNPCLTGENKVHVADGRGFVPIKELADEGKDVGVFCLNDKGKTVIRNMRNPRVTGYNKPIYKLTLDDGNIIRATENHKFRLKNGKYTQLKDLKYGDSLHVSTRYEAPFDEIFNHSNSKSANYTWLDKSKSEHRMIAEFYNNSTIPKGYVVHHKDLNSLNNSPDNLQIMTKVDHDRLHGDLIKGENNPMFKAQTEWSEEKWESYRANMSKATSGELNGRFLGVTNEDLKAHSLLLTEKLKRRYSTSEWNEYADENNIKAAFTKWREDNVGSIVGLAKWAAMELGYDKHLNEDTRVVRRYNEYTSQGYNCEIVNNKLVFIKTCETCKEDFNTHNRENMVCGNTCNNKRTALNNSTEDHINKVKESLKVTFDKRRVDNKEKQLKIYSDLKFELKRDPLAKEWEEACRNEKIPYRLGSSSLFKNYSSLKEESLSYNHKVVSIELDGYEDVYNGTVDEFHNFMVGGFESETQSGNKKWFSLNNLQCGEQLLPIGGVCLLGSLNLTQFVDFDSKDWDYSKLKEVVPVAVRFMDNVNDVTNVPLKEQEQNLKDKRRIGLGIMGYGSALMMLNLRYGSKRALEITDNLMKFIMNEAYMASSLISKEKGSFGLYDEKQYLAGNFIKNLDPKVVNSIKKNGIRNSHLLSIQPTGNSSIAANVVSGGLEPVFMPEYTRTSMMPFPPEGLFIPETIDWENKTYTSETDWTWTKEGDENLLKTKFNDYTWKYDKSRGLLRETVVKDYAVRFLEEKNKWKPEAKWAATTTELDIKEHVKTMEILAKYIDSAMSKTVNIPNDYPYDKFKELYVDLHKTGTVKGGTTYRAGTMTEVLASTKKDEDKTDDVKRIVKTTAPGRNQIMKCGIHHVTANKQPWIVIVGLLENDPYEVFAFKPKYIHLPSSITDGNLIRVKSGHYTLECSNGLVIENIAANFETDEQEALTRMISTSLRHGADIQFVFDQLNKSEGVITSFSKAIGRTLKKYLKDGLESTDVCQECETKNSMSYQEGCLICKNCGWSKC